MCKKIKDLIEYLENDQQIYVYYDLSFLRVY